MKVVIDTCRLRCFLRFMVLKISFGCSVLSLFHKFQGMASTISLTIILIFLQVQRDKVSKWRRGIRCISCSRWGLRAGGCVLAIRSHSTLKNYIFHNLRYEEYAYYAIRAWGERTAQTKFVYLTKDMHGSHLSTVLLKKK